MNLAQYTKADGGGGRNPTVVSRLTFVPHISSVQASGTHSLRKNSDSFSLMFLFLPQRRNFTPIKGKDVFSP